MSGAPRVRRLWAFLAILTFLGPQTLAAPQIFGGGKPKIPKEKVLAAYPAVVIRDKLAIAPVAAGFAGPVVDPETMMANSASYRETLAGLQSYLLQIAKAGPRPDIVPRLRLVVSDRPEAYAESSSSIVLSTALLKLVLERMAKDPETVDELLFILSHEYSHVIYDHPARFAERQKERGLAGMFKSAMKVANALNRLSRQAGGGSPAGRSTMSALQGAYALSPYIELEIYRFGFAPYKREQESLADFMAVDLMRNLERRDPRTGSTILNIYEKYDGSILGQLEAGAKHLEKEVSQAMLRLQAQAPSMMLSSGPGAVLTSAERGLKAAVGNWVGGIVKRRFSRSEIHLYYSAEFRVQGVETYSDRFYEPIVKQATSQTVAAFGALASANVWAAKAKVPTPAALARSFDREDTANEAALAARSMLLKGDVTGARRTLDAARPKATKAVLFHIVDAQTHQLAGNALKGVEAYKRAVALPEAPLNAYLDLACAQDLIDRPGEALATLNAGARKFGEEWVIAARIQHHVGREELELATGLLEKCKAYPQARDACRAAMPGEENEGLLGIIGR